MFRTLRLLNTRPLAILCSAALLLKCGSAVAMPMVSPFDFDVFSFTSVTDADTGAQITSATLEGTVFGTVTRSVDATDMAPDLVEVRVTDFPLSGCEELLFDDVVFSRFGFDTEGALTSADFEGRTTLTNAAGTTLGDQYRIDFRLNAVSESSTNRLSDRGIFESPGGVLLETLANVGPRFEAPSQVPAPPLTSCLAPIFWHSQAFAVSR